MIGDIWIDREIVSSFTVRDVIQNFRHLLMTAEIRSRFQHCNMIYITISHWIEEWTGIWLGDCFRAQIHEPLGMVDTFFSLPDAQKRRAFLSHSLLLHQQDPKVSRYPMAQISTSVRMRSNAFQCNRLLQVAPLHDDSVCSAISSRSRDPTLATDHHRFSCGRIYWF